MNASPLAGASSKLGCVTCLKVSLSDYRRITLTFDILYLNSCFYLAKGIQMNIIFCDISILCLGKKKSSTRYTITAIVNYHGSRGLYGNPRGKYRARHVTVAVIILYSFLDSTILATRAIDAYNFCSKAVIH